MRLSVLRGWRLAVTGICSRVREALDIIGIEFWEHNARALPTNELRSAIHDESRQWNESLVHMLEQEGVILRIPGLPPDREYVIPVYDALGGYIIANSILTKLGGLPSKRG